MSVENTLELPLEFTGERFMPRIKGGNIAIEHMHRYLLACDLVSNKSVLDIASGEGYGSALLSSKADSVIGVDISEEAIGHANTTYKKANLKFMAGSCENIPLKDDAVDIVVSFETIEHVNEHNQMMSEIRRVLKKNGILIISSPAKHEYSDVPKHKNPFHVKELYRREFEDLLKSNYSNYAMFGQKVVLGSGIFLEAYQASTKSFNFDSEEYEQCSGMHRPAYLIAVASDATLPNLSSSFLTKPMLEVKDMFVQLNKELKNCKEVVEEHKVLIDTQNKEIIEQGINLQAILNSKSWRLTAPVRRLKSYFK